MPYRWVALPPTMKHGPESENGLRICYISVLKKIAVLELSSVLIIHYIKESPCRYNRHTASRKKIH